jgi:hypothetical protein
MLRFLFAAGVIVMAPMSASAQDAEAGKKAFAKVCCVPHDRPGSDEQGWA